MERLRRLVCRVFGHRWVWPEMYISFDFDRRAVEVHQSTRCCRCGLAGGEDYPEMTLHLKAYIGKRYPADLRRLGRSVNRTMGWG